MYIDGLQTLFCKFSLGFGTTNAQFHVINQTVRIKQFGVDERKDRRMFLMNAIPIKYIQLK